MRFGLAIIFVFLIYGCSSQQAFTIRGDIPGNWGSNLTPDSCKNKWSYSFSEDGKKMFITPDSPMTIAGNTVSTAEYEVLAESSKIMRMRIIGEDRKTESGETVVWDLVLIDRNTFCWHRADWASNRCTQPFKRCN